MLKSNSLGKLAMLMVGLSLQACAFPLPLPGYKPTSPGFHGRVLAAETGAPIQGARVSVAGRELPSTLTGPNGGYHLPPADEFYLMVVITDCPNYYLPPVASYETSVHISHQDFAPQAVSASGLEACYEGPSPQTSTYFLGDTLLEAKPLATDWRFEDMEPGGGASSPAVLQAVIELREPELGSPKK